MVGDNVEVGVYRLPKAIALAEELELDLVEISPKASPPVCKILDYKKFLYEQKKREKALKSKATKVIIKEIRFGPQTDEHDYEFKKKHAEKFLKDGAKLKAFVFFKGQINSIQGARPNLTFKTSARLGGNWKSRTNAQIRRKAYDYVHNS